MLSGLSEPDKSNVASSDVITSYDLDHIKGSHEMGCPYNVHYKLMGLVTCREFADEGEQGQVHGDDDGADGDAEEADQEWLD